MCVRFIYYLGIIGFAGRVLGRLNLKSELGVADKTSASFLYGVSILIPCYNESESIVRTAKPLLSMKSLQEVIVINDGSKDDTLDVLIEHFQLQKSEFHVTQSLTTQPIYGIYLSRIYPKLVLIDKANGGKGDSLNAGINVSSSELVCCVDADTIVEEYSIKAFLYEFSKRTHTVAVGGPVFILNDVSKMISL